MLCAESLPLPSVLHKGYVTEILIFNRTTHFVGVLNFHNSAHPRFSVYCEEEVDDCFNILHIKLTRQPNEIIQRCFHRKKTGNGERSHFQTFTAIVCRRRLVKWFTTALELLLAHPTISAVGFMLNEFFFIAKVQIALPNEIYSRRRSDN